MSSNPQKQAPKMCKSPKSSNNFQMKPDKIILNEYESLNTNCTTIGSNNLHLVKKPQILTNMSPAYSNPSPSYPQSPYHSPAGMKSPSPQSMKPPTPQPNTFPVMQIIHNNHLLARPIQAQQQQNIIKLKPHLNILPKPAASPQPSPKPSVSPQIVIPTNQQATIMPTAQPLLLPQMPVITTPGVQFILRPQTKMQTQMQTATATPQGLILQPTSQPVLQIQPPRSQPLVRVLTNGVQLATPTTTYVTHLANPSLNQQQSLAQTTVINTQGNPIIAKKKPKKKKQKLDLANIMKLSGIGDEDDIQFESDTSQSESEHNSVHSQPNTPQPQQSSIMQPQNLIQSQQNIVQTQANILHSADPKKIGNIQISAVQQPTINATATPLVQVLNQSFQSGVIPTSQAPTHQSMSFNPFITPNFTINNGLMVQRSGGYKLTLGEDGRLILQHDPNLNQDLQSQLLLQNLFGLNSLILQPSMDQQVHSQTVQTIQQQSVQTIQQQTVQSQTIQTVQQQTVQPQSVQHSLQTIQQTIQPQIQAVQPQTVQQTVQQTIQHQTVQSQPLSALQQHAQPMQIVQPQPIQNLNQSIQSQTVHSIQSQVQPSLHSLQSQIQGQIQSQIQGQIQSILQSQLHSQNMSQGTPTLSLQSQPMQSVQTQVHSQPIVVSSQPISIQSQPISIQSQPISIHSQPVSIQSQQPLIQSQQSHPHIHHVHQAISNSQPTQTIHSQPPQMQHQSVQSQGIQTVHSQPIQTIQSQPILKVQPFQKSQPPVQTVHPQPVQTIHHHHQSNQTNDNHNPPPASYVVNLTPEQLEQLKSNGQVTVNGQTIYMQRTSMGKASDSNTNNSDNKVKLSPKCKTPKKITKITNMTKVVPQDLKIAEKPVHSVKDGKSTLVSPVQAAPKHVLTQSRIQVQPQQTIQPIAQKPTNQPSALIQPSIQTNSATPIPQPKIQVQQQPKVQVSPCVQNAQTTQTQPPMQNHNPQPEISPAPPTPEVDRILGQIIEDTNNAPAINIPPQTQQPPQRVHTIQLTPQKQQHLKSIQLQIQTLSARLTPGDTEMHNALSMLFQEQQKILASGKLLPPDKVYYHNNQLTIVNPSSLSQMSNKNEQLQVGATVRSTASETISSHQVVTSQSMKISPTSTTDTSHSVPTNPISHNPTPVHHPIQPPPQLIGPRLAAPTSVQQATASISQQTPPQHKFLPTFTKAQLIEQQLNTDQNGAVKPDIHSPFKDKSDACKRLIRYHCFDQPVLSIKDLSKADEIFELTAKHFIDKFSKMVDKYRFLRLRESMRQVQTSELMMLDRLFLAEEQQSLIRLRQDIQEPPVIEITPPPVQPTSQQVSPEQHSYPSQSNNSNSTTSTPQSQQPPDDYDEWACIQKELGCLPQTEGSKSPQPHHQYDMQTQKRAATCDSRLETLKKFRVDKHHTKKELSPSEVISKSYGKLPNANSPQNSPQNSLPSPQNHHHLSANTSQQYQMHQYQQHLHNMHMPQINSHSLANNQQQHTGASRHGNLQHQPRNVHHNSNIHMQNAQHHFSMQHIVQSSSHHHHHQQITHTVRHIQNTQQHSVHAQSQSNTSQHNVHGSFNAHGGLQSGVSANNSGNSSSNSSNSSNSNINTGSGTDNIIDEQVQSAIDSILNLQQSLDLEDTVNSMLS